MSESNRNKKLRALFEASVDLNKLAIKTVEETIKIGTKMLIKHDLLHESSIDFMQIMFRKFIITHNKAALMILEKRMANATDLIDTPEGEKMMEDPEFKQFVDDMFREAMK